MERTLQESKAILEAIEIYMSRGKGELINSGDSLLLSTYWNTIVGFLENEHFGEYVSSNEFAFRGTERLIDLRAHLKEEIQLKELNLEVLNAQKRSANAAWFSAIAAAISALAALSAILIR